LKSIFTPKDASRRTLFLENEAQINKNNYASMLFKSKQVSLLKIILILQKNWPKNAIYAFFVQLSQQFLRGRRWSLAHLEACTIGVWHLKISHHLLWIRAVCRCNINSLGTGHLFTSLALIFR